MAMAVDDLGRGCHPGLIGPGAPGRRRRLPSQDISSTSAAGSRLTARRRRRARPGRPPDRPDARGRRIRASRAPAARLARHGLGGGARLRRARQPRQPDRSAARSGRTAPRAAPAALSASRSAAAVEPGRPPEAPRSARRKAPARRRTGQPHRLAHRAAGSAPAPRLGLAGAGLRPAPRPSPRRRAAPAAAPGSATGSSAEPRGLVRDQQQHGAGGRFLQQLQERVGGVRVHLVGGIDDHHPPPAIGALRPKKSRSGARPRP
jgi:hypothetical protein